VFSIPGPFLPLPSLFPNLVPFGMVPRRMEERDEKRSLVRSELTRWQMLSDDHMLVLQVNDLFFFYEFKVFRNYFILKSTTFLLAFS